jgi:hypothetical protein
MPDGPYRIAAAEPPPPSPGAGELETRPPPRKQQHLEPAGAAEEAIRAPKMTIEAAARTAAAVPGWALGSIKRSAQLAVSAASAVYAAVIDTGLALTSLFSTSGSSIEDTTATSGSAKAEHWQVSVRKRTPAALSMMMQPAVLMAAASLAVADTAAWRVGRLFFKHRRATPLPAGSVTNSSGTGGSGGAAMHGAGMELQAMPGAKLHHGDNVVWR